jgi:hypothetical protein
VRPAALLVLVVACGGAARDSLSKKPGDDHDEGGGLIAQASRHLRTGGDGDDAFADRQKRRAGAYGGGAYGGDPYGGASYGGDPYGGTSYGNWTMPQWSYQTPNRLPRYTVAPGLTGAVEGAITWIGPPPAKVQTACGPLATVRVGADRGVRGALVFIDKISVGRATPYYGRPANVGGVVVKHGCALTPAAQIVAPLPGVIEVHGDPQRTRIRITPPGAAAKAYELQEAGLVQVEAKPGVFKVDGEDGRLAAAWVLALETPYFAITDDAGRFRIDELAAGSYDVTFWLAPQATAGAEGVLVYGPPTIVHRTVKIDAAQTAKLSITLPARAP